MMAAKMTRVQIMPDLKNYMTVEEAAARLGFHAEHVRRMLRQKDLEGIKVGCMWFIKKSSVEQYIKNTEGMNKYDRRRNNE